MSVNDADPEPIRGDSSRQADALNRGITLQIWCSVEAWVNLTEGQLLYLEGAEDFDIVGRGSGIGVQTKATAAPISLRSSSVIDLLVNYWKTRDENRDKEIRSWLITTSSVAVEDKSNFGGKSGLELWRQCTKEGDLALAAQIQSFLATDPSISVRLDVKDQKRKKAPKPNLLEFLRSATPANVLKELIGRVAFRTDSPDADVVRESVRSSIHAFGERMRMRPSDCDPALDRLFRVAAETAGRKQRLLSRDSFRIEFEDATTRRLTGAEIASLQLGAGQIQSGAPAAFGLGSSPELLIQRQVPESSQSTLQRKSLVRDLADGLRRAGTLVLGGSSGMGKSTAARLAAREIGGDWLWADLQGLPAGSIPHVLRALATIFSEASGATNLALDNLHFEAAELSGLENALAAIVRTARVRGGVALITTQRELPQLLTHKLGILAKSLVKVPRLDQEEIAAFCMLLGCPTAKPAATHAKIVQSQTSGHPRLVHARLVGLSLAGWPTPTVTDIVQTPPEIAEELDLARQLLNDAPDGDKALLYRLSVITGPFRRDHAIELGRFAPALSYPADSFDRLVGPWIDKLRGGYFRLSPLLSRAAESNWSPVQIIGLRSAVAHAMLACEEKTLLEASEVLFQGIIASDERAVTAVVVSLTQIKFNDIRQIADTLSWVPALGRTQGKPVFPKNRHINFLLRILQFRILSVNAPDETSSLCAIVDHEFSDKKLGPEMRYMWLSTALNYFEASLTPRSLVGYWSEARRLLPNLPELRESVRHIEKRSADLPDLPEMDFDGHLLMMVLARRMSVQGLCEWAAAVNELSTEDRDALHSYLLKLLFPLRLAIERAAAMAEGDGSPQHWDDTIIQLRRLSALTADWGIPEIGSFIVRAIAGVHTDFRNDPEAALAVFSENTKGSVENHYYLVEDQRAYIFYHQKRYKEALEIWQGVLPRWPAPHGRTSDRSWLYASQRAGHSAGELDRWPEAAAIFSQGGDFAKRTENKLAYGTFAVDESHARWRSGDKAGALQLAGESALVLEQIQVDDDRALLLHRARKCLEQLLKWFRFEVGVKDENEVWEQPAGLCSQTASDDRSIMEYAACPSDYLWYFLADIEERIGSGDGMLRIAQARVPGSRFVFFRGTIAQISVRWIFAQRNFSELIKEIVAVVQSLAEARAQVQSGRPAIEPDSFGPIVRPPATRELEEAITTALILLQAHALPLDAFVAPWKIEVAGLPEYAEIEPVLAAIEEVLAAPEETLVEVFQKHERKIGRTLAALRMSRQAKLPLEAVVVGHASITSLLTKSTFRRESENDWGELVRAEWQRRVSFAPQFAMPRLSIPPIQAACLHSSKGLAIAARILLQAATATKVTLPTELIKLFQALVED